MIWFASTPPSAPVDAALTAARFWRLYACPHTPSPPPPGAFTIMDSGAFSLAWRGRAIDDAHIERLAQHYDAHGSRDCFGIAPDEYLNPRQTMVNFESWCQRYAIPVIPVIQFPRAKRIDLRSLERQLMYYRELELYLARWSGRTIIAVSNPGLLADDWLQTRLYLRMLKHRWQGVWLHILGAGWSPYDLYLWRQMDGVIDSLDSISYYICAERRERWSTTLQYTLDTSGASVEELTVNNAHVARDVLCSA